MTVETPTKTDYKGLIPIVQMPDVHEPSISDAEANRQDRWFALLVVAGIATAGIAIAHLAGLFESPNERQKTQLENLQTELAEVNQALQESEGINTRIAQCVANLGVE